MGSFSFFNALNITWNHRYVVNWELKPLIHGHIYNLVPFLNHVYSY